MFRSFVKPAALSQDSKQSPGSMRADQTGSTRGIDPGGDLPLPEEAPPPIANGYDEDPNLGYTHHNGYPSGVGYSTPNGSSPGHAQHGAHSTTHQHNAHNTQPLNQRAGDYQTHAYGAGNQIPNGYQPSQTSPHGASALPPRGGYTTSIFVKGPNKTPSNSHIHSQDTSQHHNGYVDSGLHASTAGSVHASREIPQKDRSHTMPKTTPYRSLDTIQISEIGQTSRGVTTQPLSKSHTYSSSDHHNITSPQTKVNHNPDTNGASSQTSSAKPRSSTLPKPFSSRQIRLTEINESNNNTSHHGYHNEDEERDEFPSDSNSAPLSSGMSKLGILPPSKVTPSKVTEPVFAGRRDVRNPHTMLERQIVSAKGTVRGFKNRVRAGIATFWAQDSDQRNYREIEKCKIVVYTTSMSCVRGTSDRCKAVRRLFHNHMVRYEERDLYMRREIQQELEDRLKQEGVAVAGLPRIFADGIHIGGADELERLNEEGELKGLLANYPKINVRFMCDKCGGYRFVPCDACHGSKRSLIRNNFTEEFFALRCMQCDDNGLQRCEMCLDQQE